jgi:YidC/Oxa1 family membrane protein insertase
VERRFVIFVLLVGLIWLTWIPLQVYLAPKRPQRPADKAANELVAEKPGDEKPAPDAKLTGEDEAKPTPAVEENKPAVVRPAAPVVPRQWLALGSADPSSGFSGVYYFDNQGAAVECVELNGKHFDSVEDYTGYLGHLNLTTVEDGGARVNIVGVGTPAALAKSNDGGPAGLVVGDVIQQIDSEPVGSAQSLTRYLERKTKPGQSVVLTVKRKDAEQPREFTAALVRRPLEVVRQEWKGQPVEDPGELHDPLSLLLTIDSIGGGVQRIKDDDEKVAGQMAELKGLPSLYRSNWTVEQQGSDFIEFSFTLDESALTNAKIEKAGPLKIVKRYTLAKAEKPGQTPYHLNLQISIRNLGQEPAQVAYRLNGPTGLPLEGWWYSTKLSPKWMTAAGARDVAYEQADLGHRLVACPQIVSDARQAGKSDKPPQTRLLEGEQAAPFDYIGVDTQFFAAVLKPLAESADQRIRFTSAFARPVQDVASLPKTRLKTADVSFFLTTKPETIQPSAELKHEYQVFFGPKDPNVLSQYKLDALIEYGWPIFGVPAKLLRSVLLGLYGLTGLLGIPNYGIAIILLTVIVRTCMIPVSLKQARSAAKMQELAPEVQKIKDKFPDDPMKQHQAVQELYKKHNFNMFGGCAPVFLQLPIFIGLYRCLSVDIDLRDAALIPGISWASNLAGPDKMFYWKDWMPAFIADEADGYLGPFFNFFPLITISLFLIQQKMFTPPATDEQTKMQQQMMTFMTVFMGFMFFKVPAGLCIYFITSSLWGIAERKLLPKAQPKDAAAAGGASRGDGGGGLVARLFPKPASPNGSGRPGTKRPRQRR